MTPEMEDVVAALEAIMMVTDPMRHLRSQRARALARQIARTALADLRRPRLVASTQRLEIENGRIL